MASTTGTNREEKVLIIIPCYNEADTIVSVLTEIGKLGARFDTLVIDDGSTDDTYDKAIPLSPCVRLLRNLGIGGAVQTGLKYALRKNYDFCIQIDGDGQHPPAQALVLLERYREKPVNTIIGSRYLAPSEYRSQWARRFGSRLIAIAINKLFRDAAVTDPTSGMRLMDRASIRFFADAYPHDYPEPISIAWALRHGLSVTEVPVNMRPRDHGVSSINGLRTLAYMMRVIFYIVCARFQRRPPV